ncbi:amino acid adenylation domain-containing protein [Acaryochloris sp. IP29b_bin.148]|uniref:amino acid adenylation domain-containing protein n=1 Tax=Acaryochloris sp. IP29b_bin.148 TaxID=2969218 RepID=UPI002634F86C|nr:amino acid adenylation domain-containing protein [Acaryochloris sp. IP29b_bin.148]
MTQQIAGFRLSPQQQQHLSLRQENPQLPHWSHCILLCNGAIKSQRLIKALNQLISRHEVLHTSYQSLEGMTVPLQVIEEPNPLPLRNWHVPDLTIDRTELHQFCQTWPSETPHLATGDCLQAALLPCEHQALLVLALPAPCTDAATWQLLAQELASLLQDQALPSEPMQYADFAEWQNELLESEDTATGRLFWEQPSIPTRLKLPFAIQDLKAEDVTPQCLARTLAPDLSTQLLQGAETLATSPRNLCFATFQLLLSRLTSTSEFELALTLHGRKYAELEEVAGPVAKAVPFQVRLDTHLPFSEWLQTVATQLQELEQYQEYFTPTLALSPVSFDFIDGATDTKANLQPLLFTHYLNPFELKLTCIQQGQDLHLEWHHDLQGFTDQGIEQIAVLFETLLQAVLAAPQTPIKDLVITGHPPNPAPQPSPPPVPLIHQWVSAQAQRTPQQLAVIDATQSLTYQEFDQRTNQLAHLLVSKGIGPEQRVMIYGDRNLDLIVAIFAILKAGAAYVPIDAGVPAIALEQRIEIVKPSLILTLHQYANRIPATADVLYLDQKQALIANQPHTPPTITLAPENLAYIIFTSGSTGQPKGVGVEHRHLTHYIHDITSKIHSPQAGHWALASTLAADLGHTILFPCLCNGHSLHILAPERCLDAVAFAEEMQLIDVLKIVPAHLRSLMSGSQPVLPQQQIILGGEALDWFLVDQIQALAPHCQILNHYGPTETTVGVLTYPADEIEDHPRDTVTVPIGQGMPYAHVLDANLQPLPPGLPGTLYVGGHSVSRGYWQQPQLTAASFIPDPFSQQPGARLYNTGDRARYRYDGSIEFLGRQDHQVKIRGFRVELAEIEFILLQHQSIQEGVVLALQNQDHDQLMAYIVPKSWPGPESSELRDYLSSQLPEQMVPTQFVQLKTLPRLANGKCDRKSLATQPLPTEKRPFTAPRTEEEQTLAQLWSQVLGQDSISIHDNFFELGGDSILCIQMVGRATQVGLRFTPKQLFEHPTIAELATVVETAITITAEQGLVTGPVTLTPIQHWFFNQQNPDLHHWNQAVFLQSGQPVTLQYLEAALDSVLLHHDGLRSRYTLTSEGWQQEVMATSPNAVLSVVELPDLNPQDLASTLEAQASQIQASLDLTKGLLFRVVLFNLGPQHPQYLLLVCHHLVIDGVSWQILLADLRLAYQQLQQEQPINLPPKTTSFQTWATRLQDLAQSSALAQELEYWQGQSMAPVLPQDFDCEDPDLSHPCTWECALSKELTQALLHEVPATYQTQINDLLLTALVLAVGQWTGHPHLHLDLEGFGRQDLFSDLDISRTVGWFTTLYPVILKGDNPADIGGVIKEIKETLRQVPQQGIGFGLLRYLCTDVNVQKQLQAIPSAEVRFNYLGQTDQLIDEIDTLTLAPFSTGVGRAASSRRLYLLDISGVIQAGQLRLSWRYSDQLYRPTTIESLAQKYLQQLEQVIHHCQSPDAGGFTPSDFPDADLDQGELDQLMAQFC